MFNSLRFMFQHPMSRYSRLGAIGRVATWQFRSRFAKDDIVVPWIGGSKLVARRGMYGATGNIYYGLHEFSEMGFLLHFLRADDLFCDIGANIGSYTVLASRVVGARADAFEPDPGTARDFAQNIEANAIEDRVTLHNVALGNLEGTATFTRGKGPCNRITKEGDGETQKVSIRRLDDVLNGRCPSFIKIDVEGHEEQVFLGAEKTIQNPQLRAISTETFNPTIDRLLAPAGFRKMFYDPRSRSLLSSKPDFVVSNTLLVRDPSYVEERLQAAPEVRIFNMAL